MENKNVFDKVESNETQTSGPEQTEQVEVQKTLDGGNAPSLSDLKTEREEILKDGDLKDLQKVDEQIEELESNMKAPSLDDLDDVPASEKYSLVSPSTEVPKDLVLTIEEVALQPAFTKTIDGEEIKPETNSNGSYYKAKMVLKFAEELNGTKIKQGVPSIFYGVDDDGNINPRPGIPKACSDENLDDNMTSSLAKLRNRYCKFVGKNPVDVSNKEFAQGLVGKKVKVAKKTGTYQQRKWAKLEVVQFVE